MSTSKTKRKKPHGQVRQSQLVTTFGPGSDHPLSAALAARLGVQSRMLMAVYPKGDQPWMFGLSQCSYPRVWTAQDKRLFQAIGRRLTDALTSWFGPRASVS